MSYAMYAVLKVSTDLFTPFTVTLCHLDCHFPKVCNFLPLEPVKVRLDRRTGIFQILS
jgi:hypothetical protein